MLEVAFIVLCILGLCGVVGLKPICIVGLVYAAFKIVGEICDRVRKGK
jgi:hypothetical protein